MAITKVNLLARYWLFNIIIAPLGRILELNTEPLDQGTLERQYEELQKMRDADAPDFIVETLTLFCIMTEQRLKEIEKHSTPYLDIPEVAVYVHTIKGGSLTLGCKKLTAACNEFARCSERNYIAGCHKALMQVVSEFNCVKDVFQKVIELERKIFNLPGPSTHPPQA